VTPERKVKDKVRKVLTDLNAYYAMPIGTGYGNAGVPDFLVCYQGRFIGIECKAQGNKPTALQLKNFKDIESAGGTVLLIDESNVDSLLTLLTEGVKQNG
jgi:hypothetical protein